MLTSATLLTIKSCFYAKVIVGVPPLIAIFTIPSLKESGLLDRTIVTAIVVNEPVPLKAQAMLDILLVISTTLLLTHAKTDAPPRFMVALEIPTAPLPIGILKRMFNPLHPFRPA